MKNDIGLLIKQLCEKKNITAIMFSQKLKKSAQAVYDIYKRSSIDTDLLIDICIALDTPITYFFDESITGGTGAGNMTVSNGSSVIQDNRVNGSGHNISTDQNNFQKEVEHLKEIIKEKDNTISALNKLVSVLTDKK